jgi:hypothetical protein
VGELRFCTSLPGENCTGTGRQARLAPALKSPVLLLVGNGDGMRLAHAVEFFGLLGGGKGDGDMHGLPASALAVLPATTHVGWAPPHHGITTRTHLLVPMITEFLDAPMDDGQMNQQPA